MSSVNRTSERRADEQLRRTREEYENREAENAKRHKKEVRRLIEQQDRELAEIKESHENRMSDMQSRSREIMTERDQDYQEQIEDLRGMYREQMKKKVGESEQKRIMTAEAAESALNKEREINSLQKDRLVRAYDNAIMDKEKNYNTYSQKMRGDLVDKVVEQRDKLNASHQKELSLLTKTFDGERSQHERDLAQTRDVAKTRANDLQRYYNSRLNKMSTSFEDQIQSERNRAGEIIRNKDIYAQSERKEIKEKLGSAYDNKAQNLSRSVEAFKDDVNQRIDRDVRSRDNQLLDMKDKRIADNLSNQRIRDTERKSIIGSYEAKLKNIEQQKEDVFEVTKQISHERVRDVADQKDKLFRMTNATHQENMDMLKTKAKMDREALLVENKDVKESSRQRADNQIKTNLNATTEEMKKLLKYQDQTITQMKEDYRKSLVEQRLKNAEDLNQVKLRMQTQMKEFEKNNQGKVEYIVKDYESKIEQMEENHKNELKRMEETYNQRLSSREKAIKNQLETQKIKYETKISEIQDNTEKEQDRMVGRHQAELQNLAKQMSYNNKKS